MKQLDMEPGAMAGAYFLTRGDLGSSHMFDSLAPRFGELTTDYAQIVFSLLVSLLRFY
jgi:hypothetical protein